MAVIEMNWTPSNRDLRVFAVVQLIAASAVAWLVHKRLGWDSVAIGVAAISVVGMIAGMASPQWLRPLFVGWMLAAYPLGWVMSHVLVAIVFYGVVTPIGLLLRATGRDALQLSPQPGADTYWSVRPKQSDTARYFRQF